MTDVTVKWMDKPLRAGRKPKGVTNKRVTTADGQTVLVRSVDANSPSFGEDLLYVFARNVEAARRENKELLGSPSGVSAAKKAG